MQLALKKSPASDATGWDKALSWLIKARLASDYCHGGIVIGGDLYHVMPGEGLHRVPGGQWSPEKWDLIDIQKQGIPCAKERVALAFFNQFEGAKYDWISLLAFFGVTARHEARLYCFEWCWLALTRQMPNERVTPERLLVKVLCSQQFPFKVGALY